MKRTISILLLILTVLLSFISCQNEEKNPFQTTETETETTETETETIEEFYSMTQSESVSKYGIWYMAWPAITHDGSYSYAIVKKTGNRIRGGKKEEFQYPVLYKVPHGEKISSGGIPACADPMCNHKPESGCVFEWIKNISVAENRLYFCTCERIEKDGDIKTYYKLYRYDDKNNGKILIDQSQTAIYIQTHDQNLYYYKTIEDENFNAKNLYYKVDQNDKASLFCEGEAQPYTSYLFCGENKLISTVQNVKKSTTTIGVFDCFTGETKTITERSEMTIHGMYGNKLLYSTDGNKKTFYLYDVEKNTNIEFYSFKRQDGVLPLIQTNRCLIYCDQRKDSNEPFILHVYFPNTETEETYNLSEMLGKPIGTSVYPGEIIRGAITLRSYSNSKHDWVDLYEIDLKSGKVRDLRANGE